MIAEQAKRCMNMVLLEKLRFAQQKPLLVLWPSGWPPRIRLLRGCRQCLASRDYTQLWTPKPRTPSTAMKVDFAAHLTDKTFLVFRSRDSSFGVQVVKVVNSTSCYHMLHQVEFVHLMKLKVLWDIFPEVLKVKSINTSAKLPDRVYFGFEVQGPIIIQTVLLVFEWDDTILWAFCNLLPAFWIAGALQNRNGKRLVLLFDFFLVLELPDRP